MLRLLLKLLTAYILLNLFLLTLIIVGVYVENEQLEGRSSYIWERSPAQAEPLAPINNDLH